MASLKLLHISSKGPAFEVVPGHVRFGVSSEPARLMQVFCQQTPMLELLKMVLTCEGLSCELVADMGQA